MAIKLLDTATIQKIAAGEVVERPSSIVKELVENSIDANSKHITISIRNGGIDEIIVSDDGEGILKEDIDLAFTRHATSKIEDFDDIYRIYSMGFRGEALASIKAVADIEVRTRNKKNERGTRVLYSSNEKKSEETIAMNIGTTIVVKDLFKNIPVRRKFLKNPKFEASDITEILYKLACSNPKIAFKFFKDDKLVFSTNLSNNYPALISSIFGQEYKKGLREIEGEGEFFKFVGYFSDNSLYKANRKMEFVFVNNRFVYLKELERAIEDEYRAVIPNGKFPVFQLFLSIKAERLDVNIHPNKQQIKIDGLDEIIINIKSSLRNSLLANNLSIIKGIKNDNNEGLKFSNLSEKYEDLLEKSITSRDYVKESEDSYEISKLSLDDLDDTYDMDEDFTDVSENEVIYEEYQLDSDTCEALVDQKEENAENKLIDIDPKKLKYVASIFSTYLIFEYTNNQVFLFDQHACHERINYERIKEAYEKKALTQQILLKPIVIRLTPTEIVQLETIHNFVKSFGLSYDLFSQNEIAIREIPLIFENIDLETFIIDLLNHTRGIKSTYVEDILIKRACKASVKAGDSLSREEVLTLIDDLFKTTNPLTCPHGRPTFISINKTRLEKEFLRIK